MKKCIFRIKKIYPMQVKKCATLRKDIEKQKHLQKILFNRPLNKVVSQIMVDAIAL